MTDHEQALAHASRVGQYEQNFASHCGSMHCIVTKSLSQAISLSLQWWVQRQRWFAMEADVFALQRLWVEVPKKADISEWESGIDVCIRRTEVSSSRPYQLFPSPVWVASSHAHYLDYQAMNAATKGTTDRALVCVHSQHTAILTDDSEAAAWLRAQTEVQLMEITQ